MTTIVITMCSNRKRAEPTVELSAAGLPAGPTVQVAQDWGGRLRAASASHAARDLYGGRAFREAEAASRDLKADFRIVSAGLGLVDAKTRVPAYALTLGRHHADGILGKIPDGPAAWWAAIGAQSPFHHSEAAWDGRILAALSGPYLALVAREWAAWPAERLARLRLFSKERPCGEALPLAACWMPYDDRLDAVAPRHAGTQADFAQRALRHFAGTVAETGRHAPEDAVAVTQALEGLTARATPVRRRLTDAETVALILREWDAAQGRSSALLRRFRDDLGVACEQSRFKALFAEAAQKRQASLS